MKPLDYGLINIKNYFNKEIIVKSAFKSGIYKVFESHIQRTSATKVSQLDDSEHIHISCAPNSNVNTLVEKEAPICQVLTRFPISDSMGMLNEKAKTIIQMVLSAAIE